jgi:hypothetical protein
MLAGHIARCLANQCCGYSCWWGSPAAPKRRHHVPVTHTITAGDNGTSLKSLVTNALACATICIIPGSSRAFHNGQRAADADSQRQHNGKARSVQRSPAGLTDDKTHRACHKQAEETRTPTWTPTCRTDWVDSTIMQQRKVNLLLAQSRRESAAFEPDAAVDVAESSHPVAEKSTPSTLLSH